MHTLSRPILAGVLGCLLLAGCAQRPLSKASQPAETTRPSVITGIAACDAYLSSYLACHRTAGLFPPAQLQSHYQSMRDSLLQESGDSRVRPHLEARCLVLSSQLLDVLQGRPCAEQRAPANGANKRSSGR
ncbi:hypothetical protein PY254_14260 [Rhodanobacter sp. AS-Z3]|uniref:hypothetical protein n=1 Tax=Rhodanobacter sp. AS-Z3 TaxID=3031330 RepID=UPI00247A712C|nr:hypothetical protein [Rhodanobacter sp. AS-Z3]WEN14387.1 hypothetical protein PY254_14260 [Rhodanobacter sp. AS-Z3]